MPKKSQFQNLVLQQTLQDFAQQPTVVQPALTLPLKPEALVPLPAAQSLFSPSLPASLKTETMPQQVHELALFAPHAREEMDTPALSGALLDPTNLPVHSRKKKLLLRGAACLLSALLILVIYLTWHSTTPTAASPTITQQTYSSLANSSSLRLTSSPTTPTASGANSTLQAYIVGAIKHPGVYTLPANARVYQLIQAAGGAQPDADLVSINLAAKLTDGEEIYVLSVNEIPPAYTNSSSGATPGTNTGPLVNINTATETAMKQALHISATTAKKIVDYRTQHGPYTSVDQLLQVISQSIYDRIKNLVTV